MFETNNEIAKVYSQGKLTAIKVKKMPNNKKKVPSDPDFVVKYVIEVATFDKSTKKQLECIQSYLSVGEFYLFVEAVQQYARRAMHIAVSGAAKMPACKIFEKQGGSKWENGVVSRILSLTSPGPEKNAEFFITADEAPGHVNEQGLYVRNKGAKSTKWISMSLSHTQLLAIAGACQSAINILDTWSAMGRLYENLERITPRARQDNMQAGAYNAAPQPAAQASSSYVADSIPEDDGYRQTMQNRRRAATSQQSGFYGGGYGFQ